MSPADYGAQLAHERPALTPDQVEQAARLFAQVEAVAA